MIPEVIEKLQEQYVERKDVLLGMLRFPHRVCGCQKRSSISPFCDCIPRRDIWTWLCILRELLLQCIQGEVRRSDALLRRPVPVPSKGVAILGSSWSDRKASSYSSAEVGIYSRALEESVRGRSSPLAGLAWNPDPKLYAQAHR